MKLDNLTKVLVIVVFIFAIKLLFFRNDFTASVKENDVHELLMFLNEAHLKKDLEEKIVTNIEEYEPLLDEKFDETYRTNWFVAMKVICLLREGYDYGNKSNINASLSKKYLMLEELDRESNGVRGRVQFLKSIGSVPILKAKEFCLEELKKSSINQLDICLLYLSHIYKGNKKEAKKVKKVLQKYGSYDNPYIEKKYNSWFE